MNNEFYLLAWGRSYHPANWFYDPSYLANRIYYICGGTAYFQKTTRLKPGHLYLFRANPEFAVSQDENDPVDHVYFDFFAYQKPLSEDIVEVDVEQIPALRHAVLAAAETFSQPGTPMEVVESYFRILSYALRPVLQPSGDFSYITSAVLRAIHGTELRAITVDALAKAVNANVNHVIRCFKKDIGITPHKYIARLKADVAISCLRRGMGRQEIAAELGFGSVSAFSTFFKNETHRNLSEFRK